MKIGSRIHPRSANSRSVTIHGREYIFAKTEDKFGDKHFVADVAKEEHAAVLLGTDDFYIYKTDMAPTPAIKAPTAPIDPPNEDEATIPPALQAEAEQLLGGSAASISSAVGSVSSLAVVTAALAIEQAKKAPRATVVKLLEATLEGAKAAGVTA